MADEHDTDPSEESSSEGKPEADSEPNELPIIGSEFEIRGSEEVDDKQQRLTERKGG